MRLYHHHGTETAEEIVHWSREVVPRGGVSMSVRCCVEVAGHPGSHVGFVPEREVLTDRVEVRVFFSYMLAKVNSVN